MCHQRRAVVLIAQMRDQPLRRVEQSANEHSSSLPRVAGSLVLDIIIDQFKGLYFYVSF